jgi:hypothetical protein
MRRPPNARGSPPGPLLGAVLLVLACGSGTDAPARAPDTSPGPGIVEDPPSGAQAEAPGPWVPSRLLTRDRFALETALQSALGEPVGAEFTDSTAWTLSGDAVELRLEVRTWFNGAEAERECATRAGDGAQESLSLGTPAWTTADAVYVTREAACIRVSVAREDRSDLAGARAVAEALVSADE